MAICLKEKNRSVACGAKCRESTSSCDLFDSLVTAAEALPADELQPSANPSVGRGGTMHPLQLPDSLACTADRLEAFTTG